MKRSLVILFFSMILVSCSGPKIAPSIVYENISQRGMEVKNVKVKWNKSDVFGERNFSFCAYSSQSHAYNNYDNFFGPIHVEWENAKGKKLSKDLVLTKDQLPSIKSAKPYISSVYLYFTQDDVYLYTSDNPNLKQLRVDLYKKAGLTCQEYRDREYIKKWGKDW